MPYLNWKEPGDRVHAEIRSHAKRGHELVLRLSSSGAAELAASLRPVFSEPGTELRLDLPREWIVFWKLRDGESRLLLAHPQEDEWVTTVALEPSAARKVLEAMTSSGAGTMLVFGQLFAIGSFSNVEVVLEIGLETGERA